MAGISTQRKQIVNYWAVREDECGLGIDWAEAHERCWRCGYKSTLHRCHIVPDSLGGIDDPSNLVLLCGRCHREAPNVADPRFMWIWIRATGVSFYDTYWTIRGMEEFEKMFSRKPFITLSDYSGSMEKIMDEFKVLLSEEIESATIHFGEGRMNPSTIACILYRIEEKLLSNEGLIQK